MAGQDWITDVDRLAETVISLQKCLQCTICLELMTMPMKTRCGHSFCEPCIKQVLRLGNSRCPLCKKTLMRRNISKDDHLEACVQKFEKLITAIETDSCIDILSHSKQPRDTRESSNLSGSKSDNSNNRKVPKKQSARQSNKNISKTSRSSTANRGMIVECNNPRYDVTTLSKKAAIPLSNLPGLHPLTADENDNADRDTADFKQRTWIHNFPDEPSTSGMGMKNEIQPDQSEIMSDNSVSSDSGGKLDVFGDAHCDKTEKSNETIQKTKGQNAAANKLKYTAFHAKVRANLARKNQKSADNRKSKMEKISGNQNPGSSSMTIHDRIEPIDGLSDNHSILHPAGTSMQDNKQSSANTTWSRVIEFGKEMRKKKKVKKLDVSTEKNKNPPRIVEDIMLTPKSKYDALMATKCNIDNKETSNVSYLSSESKKRKLDKSLDLPNAKIISSAVSTSDRLTNNQKRSFIQNKSGNSSLQTSCDGIPCITLEGKEEHIKSLDNHQINDIIGCEVITIDSRSPNDATVLDKNRHLEENMGNMTESHGISPRARLTVLTPEKLNKSVEECDVICDIEQSPVNNFVSSSRILVENQTPVSRTYNNSAQKISGNNQFQSSTPNNGRLSLRRNQTIRGDVSPLLSEDILAVRLSNKDGTRRNVSDCRSVDSPVSKNVPSLDRLVAVRRDLNSQIADEDRLRIDRDATVSDISSRRSLPVANNDGSVSGISRKNDRSLVKFTAPRKSTNIENQTRCGDEEDGLSVKFMQLGTLIRRRGIKYFYRNMTKREQSMPAQVRIIPVYNMQQSISRSDIANLLISSNSSSDSQNSMNVTENIRLADNAAANPVIVSTNMELPMGFPSYNIASSTSEEDSDLYLNQQKITMNTQPSTKISERSIQSIPDNSNSAQSCHKTSCADKSAMESPNSRVHSRTTNKIKLLSPDKDSQLKFLSIDSPMRRHKAFKPAKRVLPSKVSDTEGNNVSVAKDPLSALSADKAGKTPSFSSESSVLKLPQFPLGKKRKRRRSNKKLLKDPSISDHTSDDMASDSSQLTIKLNNYKKSCSSSSKNSHFDSSHTEDGEKACVEPKEQDVCYKKLKRVMPIPSSDTESESPEHVVRIPKRNKTDNQRDGNISSTNASKKKYLEKRELDEDIRYMVEKWNKEYDAMPEESIKKNKSTQDSNISMKCTFEKNTASQRLSLSVNAPKSEKWESVKSSQKDSPIIEPNLFNNSSMFNSNLEYTSIHQSVKTNRSKPSQNSADPFNDDIINKVLQIDRSKNNSNISSSMSPAARKDGMSQKSIMEYNLLQDNFDEIIANVELPQSDDIIYCNTQPDRNHNRTLTEQNMFNCSRPSLTSKLRDGTQETPMMPASSIDIFENSSYFVKNTKKSSFNVSTNNVLENSDKENTTFRSQSKRDYAEDQRNDKSPCKMITSKSDTSQKERSFDRRGDSNEKHQTDVRINATSEFPVDGDEIQAETTIGNEPGLKNAFSKYDSCMNITQQQAQFQMFEEDLFGLAAENQTTTTKIISQDDLPRDEQRTPKRNKQSAQTKNMTLEEHSAEEDDVVENTPETKRRNNGSNSKMIDSSTKKDIATPSLSPISSFDPLSKPFSEKTSPSPCAITPMSGVKMFPLYQSTPKPTASSASAKHLDVSTMGKKFEMAASGGILLARSAESKALGSVQRQQYGERTPCFVCSGLTAVQVANVKQLAQKYRANYRNKFDPSVTHVIVSTKGEQNVAKSTLKYLQGIANRKWIVSYKWIEDCIKQRKLLDEIPYEATTATGNSNGAGPRNSRLSDKGLFEGFTFLCVEPYYDVSLNEYQDLLLATGATVVDTLEVLAEKKGLKGVLIQDGAHDEKKVEHWYRIARAAPIIIDWIVECIGQYKLLSLFPFIQNISSQDLCTIGFPRDLIEEDEYSDAST